LFIPLSFVLLSSHLPAVPAPFTDDPSGPCSPAPELTAQLLLLLLLLPSTVLLVILLISTLFLLPLDLASPLLLLLVRSFFLLKDLSFIRAAFIEMLMMHALREERKRRGGNLGLKMGHTWVKMMTRERKKEWERNKDR
jgi:hypothetical protein